MELLANAQQEYQASGLETGIDKRLGPWKYNNIEPPDALKKKMFCRAIKIMITKTMSLHDYVFDGKIIRQREGGSIGLDLTGEVADIYMCHWDELFLQRLSANNIDTKLYERYKDDIDLVLENEKEVLVRWMKATTRNLNQDSLMILNT